MTPKEKAEQLLKTFALGGWPKENALNAVDEIIKSIPSLPILGDGGTFGEDIELSKFYWQEVKKELEKI